MRNHWCHCTSVVVFVLYIFRIIYSIIVYQVKAQPVCYTLYMCSLHCIYVYIILLYALPYKGDVLFYIGGGRGYFMMFLLYASLAFCFSFGLLSGTHCKQSVIAH